VDRLSKSTKPSESTLPAVLWVLATIFVVYATTIPFNFVADWSFAAHNLARISLDPFLAPDTGRRLSGPDVVLNVFFFIPFGALGFGALRHPRSRSLRIVAVVLCGAALSIGVETLQLFTANRVSSLGDVMSNTLGTLIGACAWAIFGSTARALLARLDALGLTKASWFYPMIIAVLFLCVSAWEPFDASLDVGSIFAKLRAFRLDPWQVTGLNDEGVMFLRYLLFTVIAATWLRQVGVRSAGTVALAAAAAAGVGLEASQLFIDNRMPGLEDALVNVSGALAGAVVFHRLPRRPHPTRVWAAVTVATAIGAAIQQLSPFTWAAQYRPFQWVPFLNYYLATTTATISHLLELLTLYFPIGFGLPLIVRKRWHADLLAILVVLAIAAPLEYLQGWIVGRYPDVTDIGLSVVGGWFGVWVGREGWHRFRAYDLALTGDRRPISAAHVIP
jgi:glycopeptide antibiotics resistance protein